MSQPVKDPLSRHGEGNMIVPLFLVGLVNLVILGLITHWQWSAVLFIAVLWYGSLSVQMLGTRHELARAMESTEVDVFGSSGSALRIVRNIIVAAFVVGGVAGFAVLTGWT